MLEGGASLYFDLEKSDNFTINQLFSEVNCGKRNTMIATSRMLAYETEPVQLRRPYKPKPE
jgi:hypothetical protein